MGQPWRLLSLLLWTSLQDCSLRKPAALPSCASPLPCRVVEIIEQYGFADPVGWMRNWEKAWQVGGRGDRLPGGCRWQSREQGAACAACILLLVVQCGDPHHTLHPSSPLPGTLQDNLDNNCGPKRDDECLIHVT